MGHTLNEGKNRFVHLQRGSDDDTFARSLSQSLGILAGAQVDAATDATGAIWLRYSSTNESVLAIESRIPGQRYEIVSETGTTCGDLLAPVGKQVATERLPPELVWSPLKDLIEWILPTAAFSGNIKNDSRATLQLVRSSVERPPSGAICDLQTLAIWLEQASEIRLQGLTYCFDTRAKVCLVLGDPLPPIPCQSLWDAGGIFLPAGMSWSPSTDAKHLRRTFGLSKGDLLLWCETNDWSVISRDMLMPLRRSSFRTMMTNENDPN